MQPTFEYRYDDVVALALHLSPQDQVRLLREVGESYEKSLAENKENKEINLVHVVMKGEPIFSEEEKEQFRKNRERLESSIDPVEAEKHREELIRLALACPVATAEEIEMQNEIREAFRRCRLSLR